MTRLIVAINLARNDRAGTQSSSGSVLHVVRVKRHRLRLRRSAVDENVKTNHGSSAFIVTLAKARELFSAQTHDSLRSSTKLKTN